jgi:hypothetical protein
MSKEASEKCVKNSPQHSNEWASQSFSNDDDSEMKKTAKSYAEYLFLRFWYTKYPKGFSNPVVREFIRQIWLAIYQSPLRSQLTKGENNNAD